MFNPRTFENARPDGFPVLEIVEAGPPPAPTGRPTDRPAGWPPEPALPAPLPRPEQEARRFVPLQRTDLAGEVVGPVAALRLTQRFRFTREQCPWVVEATYRFPLPGDAAVTGVRVRFGEVEIDATIAERAAAEREYRSARDEGGQAALLTREAPDVFTLQVAGLAPDEEIVIETRYVQLARPEGAGWALRVPLTTVPRYVRGDERGSPHAEGQPLAVLRDPGHRFALDLEFEAVREIASRTHRLSLTEGNGGRQRACLADGEVVPDRDCVLSWLPAAREDRPTLCLLRHDEAASAAAGSAAHAAPPATHLLALVAPPGAAPAAAVPRELILLIDHSGSMSGPKWEAADWAVQNLLAGLTPDDTFNLGLFHSTTRWFARAPVRGDARTVEQARAFLLRHTDSGGTELGVALEQALGQRRDGDGRARHVVIVTDAEVSDAGRILALVEREAGRSDRRRVDVLCIDAAPNSGLALELAERGGGIARFLTSDPDANDIASALDDVLADWAAPVLRNLALEVDRAGVQAAGRAVTPAGVADHSHHSRIDLGDLPAGRAVWVAIRVDDAVGAAAGAPLTVRLLADGRELAAEQPAAGPAGPGRAAIAALFGARRVLDLELAQTTGLPVEDRLRQLGYDPEAVRAAADAATPTTEPPIYHENARADSADAVRGLLLREALRYGIVCSETAFVAVRREAGRRVEATVAVANALAHGWSDRFLMSRVALAAPMRAFGAPPSAGPAGGRPLSAMADLAPEAVAAFAPTSPVAPAPSPAHQPAPPPASGPTVLYAGVPVLAGGEAVLFDSRQGPTTHLPAGGTLTRLRVRIVGGGADQAPSASADGVALALFVDDLAAPRARVRLADLLRQGGERPLNVRYRPGQVVRLVLVDPHGAWAAGAPALEVAVA